MKLSRAKVQLLSLQYINDCLDMLDMFIQCIRIDCNVVQIDVHKHANERPKDMIHKTLVSRYCIAITLLQYKADHVPIGSSHRSSFNMLRLDANLLVSVLSVYQRAVGPARDAPQDPFHVRQR